MTKKIKVNINQLDAIIFDFDGVLVESNEIRFNGFRKLFKNFPENSKIGGYPARSLYDWQKIQVKLNKMLSKIR